MKKSTIIPIKTIKSFFPFFKANTKLAYLDSAATTQTCAPSLVAMDDYYKKYRSNVHRGVYDVAVKATEQYENARTSVAELLNAVPEEIVFTNGTTHSLNLLAYSLAPRLTHRDNIVLTRFEHHSNMVPWQQMAKHYGFQIRFIELTKDFRIDLESAKKLIDSNTKIVSFALVSNVLGTIAPATELIKLAKNVRATTIIDAAQAIAHLPIDVKKLDVDFLAFSGHKMYGPTGIGGLYGKKVLLEEHLEPFFFGGDMVSEVSYETAEWNVVPYKFEAGTPNIAGAIGLGAAARFIMNLGWKEIQSHETKLTTYALKKLQPLVTIFGPTNCHPERSEGSLAHSRTGAISFSISGVHPHDIAEIVNRDNVAIRVGFHCAEPLHRKYNLVGTARASLGIYNTKEDIDRLVTAIKKVKKVFV
jgi:cysteine desulfurase/selenocysteine lyase